MRWGLVPFFWKKPLKEVPATFNARAETVHEKPMFREAFRRRRCIIPASGFYEWTGEKGNKTPHLFTAADASPILAFAGLWDKWKDPATGEEVLSCTMVVSEATAWMAPYHDRMPVLLTGERDRELADRQGRERGAAARCRISVARVGRVEPGEQDRSGRRRSDADRADRGLESEEQAARRAVQVTVGPFSAVERASRRASPARSPPRPPHRGSPLRGL